MKSPCPKTPFDADELLKAGLDEMRRTIREKEPERPSTRVSTLCGEELTTTAKRRGLEAPKLIHVLRGDRGQCRACLRGWLFRVVKWPLGARARKNRLGQNPRRQEV